VNASGFSTRIAPGSKNETGVVWVWLLLSLFFYILYHQILMEDIISNFRNDLAKMVDDIQKPVGSEESVNTAEVILSFTKEAEKEGNIILSSIPNGINNKQLKNVIAGIIAEYQSILVGKPGG
jgi:hypothetical protein